MQNLLVTGLFSDVQSIKPSSYFLSHYSTNTYWPTYWYESRGIVVSMNSFHHHRVLLQVNVKHPTLTIKTLESYITLQYVYTKLSNNFVVLLHSPVKYIMDSRI